MGTADRIAKTLTDAVLDRVASQSRPKVIVAYHGSPYSFDRFDASKIGTGDGLQAHGYGHYFAGHEGDSQHYRTVQMPELSMAEERELAEILARMRALKALAKAEGRSGPRAASMSEEWDRLADRRSFLENHPGHMYEVELGVSQDSLLDYDQPFSTPAGIVGAEVLRQDNPVAVSADMLRAIQDGSWSGQSFRGRSPYSTAAWELKNLARTREGSQALLEAGIPGVRYFDGNSRGAAEGTRNYVMFPGTEDRIRILRKYGLLGPAAAGMMGGEE